MVQMVFLKTDFYLDLYNFIFTFMIKKSPIYKVKKSLSKVHDVVWVK